MVPTPTRIPHAHNAPREKFAPRSATIEATTFRNERCKQGHCVTNSTPFHHANGRQHDTQAWCIRSRAVPRPDACTRAARIQGTENRHSYPAGASFVQALHGDRQRRVLVASKLEALTVDLWRDL